MRAGKSRSPDDIREHYLGEIAPLLAAARNLESLSLAQKRQVRKRVLRTVLGSRPRLFRLRLSPIVVAVGLLVAGGVAFATAERLGLIHRADQGAPNLKMSDRDPYKRRAARPKRELGAAAQKPTADDGVLPNTPDSLPTVPLPAGEVLTGPPSAQATQAAESRESYEVSHAELRAVDYQAALELATPKPRSAVARAARAGDAPVSRATPIAPTRRATSFAAGPARTHAWSAR